AFLGDGLGEERLAGAGRTVEERADVRRQAARGEELRIAQRQLDGLLQPRLDVIEPADVAPGYVGNADQRLAQRRRPDLRQGGLEILALDAELLQGNRKRRAVVRKISGAAAQAAQT